MGIIILNNKKMHLDCAEHSLLLTVCQRQRHG